MRPTSRELVRHSRASLAGGMSAAHCPCDNVPSCPAGAGLCYNGGGPGGEPTVRLAVGLVRLRLWLLTVDSWSLTMWGLGESGLDQGADTGRGF